MGALIVKTTCFWVAPVRVTLVALSDVVRPLGETCGGVRVAFPRRLPRFVSVMLDLVEEPTLMARLPGLAEIEKSEKAATVRRMLWTSPLVVPVILTVYVPALADVVVETVRVVRLAPFGKSSRLNDEGDGVRPIAVVVAVRLSVPVRPAMLVTIMVVELDPPTGTRMLFGSVLMAKFCEPGDSALMITKTEWEIVPSDPVIVTL